MPGNIKKYIKSQKMAKCNVPKNNDNKIVVKHHSNCMFLITFIYIMIISSLIFPFVSIIFFVAIRSLCNVKFDEQMKQDTIEYHENETVCEIYYSVINYNAQSTLLNINWVFLCFFVIFAICWFIYNRKQYEPLMIIKKLNNKLFGFFRKKRTLHPDLSENEIRASYDCV